MKSCDIGSLPYLGRYWSVKQAWLFLLFGDRPQHVGFGFFERDESDESLELLSLGNDADGWVVYEGIDTSRVKLASWQVGQTYSFTYIVTSESCKPSHYLQGCHNLQDLERPWLTCSLPWNVLVKRMRPGICQRLVDRSSRRFLHWNSPCRCVFQKKSCWNK